MRHLVIAAVSAVLAASAASPSASEQQDRAGDGIHMNNIGILATTPTRMDSSRREMNIGREQDWAALRLTPMQLRTAAEETVARGGLQCTITEVRLEARLLDKTPIIEVACEEGAGMIVAATEQVQASDCIDLVGTTGSLGPCRLPRNVALTAAAR